MFTIQIESLGQNEYFDWDPFGVATHMFNFWKNHQSNMYLSLKHNLHTVESIKYRQ